MKRHSLFYPVLVLLPFFLSSCLTEVEEEPPIPVIEYVEASPPVFAPGGESAITVDISFDRHAPNEFTYGITILDGGNLAYEEVDENSGYRSYADGVGDTLPVVTSKTTITAIWTAPEEPGEYEFGISVSEEYSSHYTATDSLTISVSGE